MSDIYINNKTKLTFLHLVCNKTFEMRPNDFQQGYRCPHCFGAKNRLKKNFSQEEYIPILLEQVGDYFKKKTSISLEIQKNKEKVYGN